MNQSRSWANESGAVTAPVRTRGASKAAAGRSSAAARGGPTAGDPGPLLGERERRRDRAGTHQRDLEGRGGLAQLVDPRGERSDRGVLEDGAQRQGDVERLPDPRDQAGGEERVPAELEEALVAPRGADAQQVGPDLRPPLLADRCA